MSFAAPGTKSDVNMLVKVVSIELVASNKGRTRPSIAFADRFIVGAFGFSS